MIGRVYLVGGYMGTSLVSILIFTCIIVFKCSCWVHVMPELRGSGKGECHN